MDERGDARRGDAPHAGPTAGRVLRAWHPRGAARLLSRGLPLGAQPPLVQASLAHVRAGALPQSCPRRGSSGQGNRNLDQLVAAKGSDGDRVTGLVVAEAAVERAVVDAEAVK